MSWHLSANPSTWMMTMAAFYHQGERTTWTWMIPVHKGDDDGWREWKPEYIMWYCRLFQQCLWKSNFYIDDSSVQGRWWEQRLSVAMPLVAVPTGSLESWHSPPFTIHSLEQSANGIYYNQHLLEQSTDRNHLLSLLFTTWFTTCSASSQQNCRINHAPPFWLGCTYQMYTITGITHR